MVKFVIQSEKNHGRRKGRLPVRRSGKYLKIVVAIPATPVIFARV